MANSAITAKARAVHGKFLTKDDYTNLLHRNSVPAAVSYLKTKPMYRKAFIDTDEAAIGRRQAEEIIKKNVFDNYIRISGFSSSGKNGIMSFLVKQLEADQLIKAVSAVAQGMQSGYVTAFPDHISEYVCYDPLKLAEAKNLAELSDLLTGTMYHKPLKALMTANDPDINKIVTTINVCYIKWAFAQIDKSVHRKAREEVKSFFLRKVDADNLLTCYRMIKSFGYEPDRINELMIPYHRKLKPKDIDAALKMIDPVSALRDLFVRTRITAKRVSDIPEISVGLEDHRYFRHRLAVSTNEIESLYSLMMLFRDESSNLCRIIEGIRYGLPPEEIEKYLIL